MTDQPQQESDPIQETRDKVELAMGEIFGALHHQALTDEVKHAAKVGIIAKLTQLQANGDLPDDISMVHVSIQEAPKGMGVLDVQLPWFLRAYLQEGPSYKVPRFTHDCENCTFLAHVVGHDLYYCTQMGGSALVRSSRETGYEWRASKRGLPTVIARYGNDGPDYMSGMEFGKTGQIEELHVAYNLAQEKGLLKGDGPTLH